MTAGVLDFSKWNDMPDYARRGFKTREESWENSHSHCRSYCVLTSEQLLEQRKMVREINDRAWGR